jgi:AcrR family transcriptional regulator
MSESSRPRSFAPGIVPSRRPGKEGGTRARNRDERARALCESALRLFLERGVEAATVDEITRAAGVAKGSFYRYYADKEQLVEALFTPLEAALGRAMEGCLQALSQARSVSELDAGYALLAGELLGMFLEAPDVVRLYLQECRGPAEGARKPIRRLSDQIIAHAEALTDAAQARGLLKDLPPRVTAMAVVGAVEGMLVQFLEGRALGVNSPAEATRALITMVLDGIRLR